MDPLNLHGQELIEAHRRAKQRMGWLRVGMPVVIILLITFNLWSLVDQVRSVDTGALATELELQATELWPRVEEHLADVALEVQPILIDALETQSAKMAPELDRRMEKQIEEMKVRVEADFKRAVEASLEEIERRQRAALVEEIPALKGDREAQDRVMEAVRQALVQWAMRELTTTFAEHMAALDQIRKTLQVDYMAPAGAKADPQEALLIWLDLMNQKVGGDSAILGTGPEDILLEDEKKPGRRGDRRSRGQGGK